MATQVKVERIEGHDVTFSVTDEGQWIAEAAVIEGRVTGDSLQEVRTKATGRLRRATAKLAIAATLVNVLPEALREKTFPTRADRREATLARPIVLVGISQREQGAVMYRFEDTQSKTHRLGGFGSDLDDPERLDIITRRLTKAEEQEYRTRRAHYDEARDHLLAWIRDHQIKSVRAFLEEKIAEAIDTPPAERKAARRG